MTDTPDLFSLDVKRIIETLEVTATERVVVDYWIIVDGVKFDAENVYTTLTETCDDLSDSYITDHRMVEVLQNLRVIEHGGHRSGMTPEKGPNYDYFMAQLKKRIAIAQRRMKSPGSAMTNLNNAS